MRSSSSSPSLSSTSSLIQLRQVESSNTDNLNNNSPPQSSSLSSGYSSKINSLFTSHKAINPIVESNTNSNSNASSSSNFVINIPQSMTVFNLKDISSKLKSYKAIQLSNNNAFCLNKPISSPNSQNNQPINNDSNGNNSNNINNGENSFSRINNEDSPPSSVHKTIIQLKETLPLEPQNYSDFQNTSIDNFGKYQKYLNDLYFSNLYFQIKVI